MKRYASCKALLLAALALCLALPASAGAIDNGGIGGKPANPRADNPRSESIFVYELEPGEGVEDGVQIMNGTDQTKTVLVYAVDSQIASGGAFACDQAVDKPISVGSWVSVEEDQVTLGPGEKQIVNFDVDVPKDASPGEHNGCIVMQDTDRQRSSEGGGIVLSMRSAIRVAVTVPGEIQKGLALIGTGIEARSGQKVMMSVSLRNSGNVSLDTSLEVKLMYALGPTAVNAGGSYPVLSGSEARFNFEGERPFWGGWFRLVADARYNDNPDASIGEGQLNANVGKTAWVFIAPAPAAAAIEGAAAVLLAGVAVIFVRRRLVHKKAMSRATRYQVQPGENLHTIAEKYKMSWKLLARINKLKPPYQLRTGQSIIVTLTRADNRRNHRR